MTIWGKSRSLLEVSKTDFHENKIIPRKYGMTCDKSILTLLCFLIYFCSSYSSSSSHGNRWPKSALTLTFSKVVFFFCFALGSFCIWQAALVYFKYSEPWKWAVDVSYNQISDNSCFFCSLEKSLSHGQKIHVLHYTSSSKAHNALN